MRLDRLLLRAALTFGLALSAAAAPAQPAGYGPPPPDPAAVEAEAEAPPPRRARVRSRIQPYLEVAQVVSAELDGGDVLTYTTVAAGIDGRIETRRVVAQIGDRYERRIEWEGDVPDQDIHSGIALLHAQVVPGLLDFDAGALATRTGGYGRALGVTDREGAVEIYSAYAGPTLSTRAGPLSVAAAYRFGYVAVDDDAGPAGLREDFDSATTHSLTGSVGMGPGRLPFGWTLGAGYVRSESGGDFDHEFEGAFVRGDIVVPLSPTFAVTAGVGYENIQASQFDIARDANGLPIIGPGGGPVPDPGRPRLLTYDLDGLIYDAGLIWRPSARTELQARAGHRYGGTTVVASLSHQIDSRTGLSAQVYDTVETFSTSLVTNISNLPSNFQIQPNPLTGGFGGCVFGADPGTGTCFDRSLQAITGSTFRARGANILLSGRRGLWSFGLGAGYGHRRYARPADPVFDPLVAREDENVSIYGSMSRRLSRTSEVSLDAFASWFDSDLAAFDDLFSTGATVSYHRSFLLERLRLIAALGLYHTEGNAADSTVASGLLGLRYSF